jgi:hypothetical protein
VTVGIRTSDPVVANLDVQHPVVQGRPDLGVPGVGVLDDVGERLGHDEVRTRLDLRRQPLGRHITRSSRTSIRRAPFSTRERASAGFAAKAAALDAEVSE